MANTRDILGDQETLEALISNDSALTEFVEDGIKDAIGEGPLSNKDKLVMINLGEIAKVCGFNNDSKLMHLLLHNTTMVQLTNTSSFANTPIKAGYGTIYVPESLLATYRANANWKTYFFKRLEDYPNYEFGNITDSWETIANNANYANDYAIGDTKTVGFGEYGYMNMELVAFDADDKADGTGKAHMTWIAKDLITRHNMNDKVNGADTTAGGWEASGMRKWLRGEVLPLMPKALKDNIVAVNKVQSIYTTALVKDGQTTQDTIWIPSHHEVGFGTTHETTGAVYSKFDSDSARIKKNIINGLVYFWWLRSAYSTTVFQTVGSTGSNNNYYNASYSTYVAPGFCIGGKSESQYWTDLVAAIKEETYTRLYSVGDKLPYTVDGNTYHAVIVGIDADEDALGNKIPFSFITEELWAETAKMNDTATNANGWSASKMRTTTLPAIKAQLPEYVTSNIVKAKKYSYDKTTKSEQITYDDVWIPNFKELGFTSNQETNGATYSGLFTDYASKIKKKIGSSSENYWTRTAHSGDGTYFRAVDNNGNSNYYSADSSYGVALSFCIGLVTEESLWNELYDAIDDPDASYRTKYAVGDKLPYTIGDNVYHAVIAGIDVDEDENGNKIPVTFVTEELYAETAAMNDTATNGGGWKESKMRKTMMPAIEALLPEHLRNRINAVKKVSMLTDETEQITYDSVWIPNCKELGFTSKQETDGVAYTGLFLDNNSRIKKEGTFYFVRTASSSGTTKFYVVDLGGTNGSTGVDANVAGNFPVSFCVGHIPEKIQ